MGAIMECELSWCLHEIDITVLLEVSCGNYRKSVYYSTSKITVIALFH